MHSIAVSTVPCGSLDITADASDLLLLAITI